MRLRILISVAIGVASGLFCWFLLLHFRLGAGDLARAIRMGQRVLAHQNPYDSPLEVYPLTATFFALPLLPLRPEIAGGIFYGASSAILAFGLTRDGYRRLLIFLAYPYWAGLLFAQWQPLTMATAFFPLLLPVTMAKPQIGLPIALTHLTRRGVLACAIVLLLTVAAMPLWPLLWLHQLGYYQRFFPIAVLPGPLLALALLRYRDRDAWLLFLSSLMPQRWFFDAFILWLIPKSRREIVWTVFLSWGAGIWRWYYSPHSYAEVGRWEVLFLFLPMLVVVLLRARSQPATTEAGAAGASTAC